MQSASRHKALPQPLRRRLQPVGQHLLFSKSLCLVGTDIILQTYYSSLTSRKSNYFIEFQRQLWSAIDMLSLHFIQNNYIKFLLSYVHGFKIELKNFDKWCAAVQRISKVIRWPKS